MSAHRLPGRAVLGTRITGGRRPRPPRRVLVIALVTLLSAVGGGAAYGYWRAGGAGSAAGSVGTTVAITLSSGSLTGDLYPGAQGNVVLSVTNPNTALVRIGSLTLDASQGTNGIDLDASHSSCPASTFSYATQTNSGAGWTVPAKVGATNGSLPITLSSAVTLSSSAINACQGATATIYLQAGP